MPNSPSRHWLDDFRRAYVTHRPVSATFMGIHDHDHRLPDLSDAGVGDAISAMEGLLARMPRLQGERGGVEGGEVEDPVEAWDLRLAAGFLRLSLWEAQAPQHHRANPAFYTGEAIFGILSLFLSDFAPLPDRVERAIHRLEEVPGFLEHARRWLLAGPGCHREWTGRALRECSGALAFLDGGVDALCTDLVAWQGETGTGGGPRMLVPAFRRAADQAARAFGAFQVWLEAHHLPRHRQEVACGPEILDLHIREGHFLPHRAGEIAAYAREEMSAARDFLRRHAEDFGAASPEEALSRLPDLHPDAGSYVHRYQDIWSSCRRVAEAHDLVTWPDFPIRYVERPRWARSAAPWLYFLFYRSPAPWNPPPVHDYLVAPLPEGRGGTPADPDEVRAFLRANNDSVIRANHVVHHGGLGHHVQNFHAARSPSLVGRMAATDCASRIAMHCGGTMAEGWACYATALMSELAEAGVEGGFTRLEAYAERASRVRMCARAVVDVEVHSGRMTLGEAAAFYRREAGMTEGAALSESVKNTMFPGMALMYLMGTDTILALRAEAVRALGDGFRTREFHDRFLSWGSIPVTAAADLMRREWKRGTGTAPAASS